MPLSDYEKQYLVSEALDQRADLAEREGRLLDAKLMRDASKIIDDFLED